MTISAFSFNTLTCTFVKSKKLPRSYATNLNSTVGLHNNTIYLLDIAKRDIIEYNIE